jgi:putative membrane-bound dehydrogenase-like protein
MWSLGTIAVLFLSLGWLAASQQAGGARQSSLRVQRDDRAGTLSIFRQGSRDPIVTQHMPATEPPYLHPIVAPSGRTVVTGASRAGSRSTGLGWALARVNGRDAVALAAGSWRRGTVEVTTQTGDEVRWRTVYDVLDESGTVLLTQTEWWTVRERDGKLVLDVEWRGAAASDVTIGEDSGLRLQTSARDVGATEIVNAARQRDTRADGQRAMWIDRRMHTGGRGDPIHVAIFDHPDNRGYPRAWRVTEPNAISAARSAADLTIKQGETEVVRHRIVVYAGALNDVELTTAWSDYSGNRSTYSTSALWSIAQREGRAEKFLTGPQAAAAMTTMTGYEAKAWASEPTIEQPMAFGWDDRGRLWIAENRDYETRVRGFSNSGNSRIVILEDTDRDGVADSRKVFMDGIVFPSALAVGFDGVFIGAPPNLLFVPDRNGDDRADDDIEVRLTGWGISDRHEVMNSLHWGPDGWLYGLQGFATTSKVRKPVGKGRLFKRGESFPDDLLQGEGVEINGAVWRYHPTKDRFEVVAHGFSNPWGIDYDAKGQLVMTACVIPHLWHVVPGGIYQRQGGQHFNPYVYADIQTIADHRHRSAHGGARVYQSDAFPASQVGRIFMANIHEHAVLSDVLERKGSGFRARHGDDFVMANNAQWIGFSVEIGPDGALYVLDWHDADICGADVHHHETGRIFRIAPARSSAKDWPGRYGDLRQLSDTELINLQTSPSDWHARRARVILQGRAAKRTLEPTTTAAAMQVFTTQNNQDWRLRAMWTLHVIGGWTSNALTEALADRDEYVRAWAIQLLSEEGTPSAAVVERFARMAREDRSPVVRLYLASALQRLDPAVRWSIAGELVMHAEDAQDPNLPTMLWLGVEPLVEGHPAIALERAARGRIPSVARFVARRAVDAGALDALSNALRASSNMQADLLEGMRDGLEGRVGVVPPSTWAETYARLKGSSDPRVAQLTDDVAQRFGDIEAAGRNLTAVRDAAVPVDARRRALQVLSAQRRPELVTELSKAIDDPAIRVDAIRAIAAYDDAGLGKLLVSRFNSLSEAERVDAVQTLASRGRYGRMLTEALAAGTIAKRDVPPHVARQLRRVVGERFSEVWGAVEQSANEERAYARYRGLLNEAALKTASAARGRDLFQKTCGACHKLYGDGGTIGPDITGSNRTNLDYLLANVLSPNADVQDAYKMVVVTTRDGRTHAGSVAGETDRQLTLRVVGGDPVTIAKADIQSRDTTPTSMMPAGLFDALTDREVLDLVAYLRSVEPVKTP